MTATRRPGAASICVYRISAPASECERLTAELHSLGSLGLEERAEGAQGALLLAYFGADPPVPEALRALEDRHLQIRVQGPESVADTDWEREWRRGLAPRKVGPLWIRPSWCESQGTPEIVVDPQQAFGSGEHATTRLALALVLEELRGGDHVLDVGCGSGILSLAALRMGAGRALGLDHDPVACLNAAQNAQRNGAPVRVVCATPAALAPAARFELVVCNMLIQNLSPCLDAILAHASRTLILSGQLESERGRLDSLLEGRGWRTLREISEAQSGDVWCARVLAQSRTRQSSSSSPSVSSSV